MDIKKTEYGFELKDGNYEAQFYKDNFKLRQPIIYGIDLKGVVATTTSITQKMYREDCNYTERELKDIFKKGIEKIKTTIIIPKYSDLAEHKGVTF